MSELILPIQVIGIGPGGLIDLPPSLQKLIGEADLLCGGLRQLGYVSNAENSLAERWPLENDLGALCLRLDHAARQHRHVVVLTSGDPLLFGLGATFRRFLPAARFRFHPQPSSVQLAFARLGEPWQGAEIISVHGQRPLEPLIPAAQRAQLVAVLTDQKHTPAVIGAFLRAKQLPDRPVAICARLGFPDEEIIYTTLYLLPTVSCPDLNVLVLLPPVLNIPALGSEQTQENLTDFDPPRLAQKINLNSREGGDDLMANSRAWRPGFDDAFFARKETPGFGLLTKREPRVLTLAALALTPGEVFWDIGAGSGSVSFEAASLFFTTGLQIYAVESDPLALATLEINLRKLGPDQTRIVVAHGLAPEACSLWPDPDAVFVGGSHGYQAEIIALVEKRLRPGGRLVFNFATLENLVEASSLLKTNHWQVEIVQVQVARGQDIAGHTRLASLNPVFILKAWRTLEGAAL